MKTALIVLIATVITAATPASAESRSPEVIYLGASEASARADAASAALSAAQAALVAAQAEVLVSAWALAWAETALEGAVGPHRVQAAEAALAASRGRHLGLMARAVLLQAKVRALK